MVEVYRDGHPTNRLFMCEENARLYIMHQNDDATYEIKPYSPW